MVWDASGKGRTRRRISALGPLAAVVLTAAAARADHAPVYVLPAIPGVPVVVAHQDASFAVVEGDWGLHRPGWMQPTVIRRRDAGNGDPYGRRYFPSSGYRPGYGRLEIEPSANRLLPPRAESFDRVWSAGSQPGPVTQPVPYDPPPVILAPRIGDEREPLRRRN